MVSKRGIALAVGVCGVLGAGSAIAAAGGGQEAAAPTETAMAGPSSAAPSYPSRAQPGEIQASLRARFGLLRQPVRTIRGQNFAVAQDSVVAGQGANPDLAHVIPAARGPIAVVPGDGVLCIGSGVAAGCPSIAAAESGKAYVVEVCSPNLPAGTSRLFGLLPDGASDVTVVSKDGSTRPVGLDGNAYVVESTEPLRALKWTQAGTAHEESLPDVSPACGG
jgi:hypothetical protein